MATTTLGSETANADVVIGNRDPAGLRQIAKDNIGTPASDVALRLAKTIESQKQESDKLFNPIEKAGGVGTPQGNIAVANAFSSVADQPQWGTALIKYVLGDKQGAVKQITGGDITKKVTYDNNGDQILETHNALGEPLAYVDRKTGQNISEQEYAQRVGGISAWENSLKGQTEKEIRKTSAAALVAEENQKNTWYQITQSHKPMHGEIYNTLQSLKTDLDPTLYNQIIKNVSQSLGATNTKSTGKIILNQLNDARNRGESVTVDERISGQFGIPKGIQLEIKGDYYVSKDNKYSISLDKLKSEQDTNNAMNEASKNASQTMASIVEAERLNQISPQAAARLRRTIEMSQQIGREMTDAVDKVGKPSFISLPTSATFVDKQAQVMAQALQGLHNADQMEQYLQYRKDAMKGHTDTNTVPMPGQIGSGYVGQPLAKEIRKFYGDEINKVMAAEYTAKAATPAQQTVAQPGLEQAAAKPGQAVAPPAVGAPAGAAVPAKVTPADQKAKDVERTQILTTEANKAQAALDNATKANDAAAIERAKNDLDAVQRELKATTPKKPPATKLPKGVPPGSVATGKFSANGKKVYRAPDGSLYTED
jgi:hypothetical protein